MSNKTKKISRGELIVRIVGVALLFLFIVSLIGSFIIYMSEQPEVSELQFDRPKMQSVGFENKHYSYMVDKNSGVLYLTHNNWGTETISPVIHNDGSAVLASDYDVNGMAPDIVYVSDKNEKYAYVLDKTTGCFFILGYLRGDRELAPAYMDGGLPMTN